MFIHLVYVSHYYVNMFSYSPHIFSYFPLCLLIFHKRSLSFHLYLLISHKFINFISRMCLHVFRTNPNICLLILHKYLAISPYVYLFPTYDYLFYSCIYLFTLQSLPSNGEKNLIMLIVQRPESVVAGLKCCLKMVMDSRALHSNDTLLLLSFSNHSNGYHWNSI